MPTRTVQDAIARAAAEVGTNANGLTCSNVHVPILLRAQLYLLEEVLQGSRLGQTYYRVTPRTLSAGVATKVLERETDGRIREVDIAVDSPADETLPTVRVGNSSAVSASAGGAFLSLSSTTQMGKVSPDTELWAVSSATINVYVIERA